MKWLWVLLVSCVTLCASNRSSGAPYISGDAFRAIADFLYDETSKSFSPRNVQYGDVIFVKTDYIEEFFQSVHPRIKHPYVIITHNSDYPAPWGCADYLDDPKVLAWFGQNVEGCIHPKLRAIPIGVANQYITTHGNIAVLKGWIAALPMFERTNLVYMNIAVGTNIQERGLVHRLFTGKSYCFERRGGELTFDRYLRDLAMTKFVLSPRGNGLDCHRTWESLYMGAIPIVRSSSLDPILETLPVVIIQDWSEVTEEFLEAKYAEIRGRDYDMAQLYMPYWVDEIRKFKRG